MRREAALRLRLDERRLTVEHRCQGARVLGRDAARELDRRVGGDGLLELRVELAEVLVREHHADVVLAGLGEDEADVPIEVVRRLVDVDEGGHAAVFGEGGPLLRRLRDHGDEEAAEDLGALLLQEVFRGVDEDDLACVHLREEVELRSRMREHALERLVLEDAPQAAEHLLLGLLEFPRGELALEEVPGGAGELRDIRREPFLAPRFHQLAERMDGRVRNVQHEPRDVAEDDVLLLRHLGREQRAQHEVVKLEDGVGEALALQGRITPKPIDADLEEVEGDRPFDVARIDHDDPLVKRRAGREAREVRDLANEITLAIEHDDGALAPLDGFEILADQVLQRLRLAVAGAGDDVVVLEPGVRGQHEIQCLVKDLGERRAPEVGYDELLRVSDFGFGGQLRRFRKGFGRGRIAARGRDQIAFETVEEPGEDPGFLHVVIERDGEHRLNDLPNQSDAVHQLGRHGDAVAIGHVEQHRAVRIHRIKERHEGITKEVKRALEIEGKLPLRIQRIADVPVLADRVPP